MPASIRTRRFAALTLLVPSMLLSLVLTNVSFAPEASARVRTQMISTGLSVARHQIGDPYRSGAAGPGAFDCSGLLYYSFRKAGFRGFPRTSDAQARFVRHVSRANLRPGDLVFFHSGGNVYHAAIFAGRRHGHVVILHSPRSGERVSYARPWTNSWFGGTLRGR
jgi:cell wall-associated NlpC family hydrolase